MRIVLFAAVLASACVTALAGCASVRRGRGEAPPGAAALVGTWRLASFEMRTARGVRPQPGRAIQGQLMYDANGHMSAHLTDPGRPRFASSDQGRGTDLEVRAAFAGYVAYYGTYTVTPARGVVTHHIQGALFPNWVGSDQVRYFRLEGERLTLTTAPIRVAGEDVVAVSIWERDH